MDESELLYTGTASCDGCNNHHNSTLTLQLHHVNFSENGLLYEEAIILALRPTLHYADLYIYIIWYIIGLPANTLAFFVWIQKQMLNSSACYMAALSLTDTLFLLVHCIGIGSVKWFPSLSLFNYPAVCQLIPLLYTAAQYMSALLVLAFTIEQYIAICHPFKRNRFCRSSIAKKVLVGVVLSVLSLSSPQAYFFSLVDPGDGKQYCTIRTHLLEGGSRSFWTIWTWVTEMVMFGIVPISCLILNIIVIYQLKKAREVKLVRNYSCNSKGSIKDKTGATTVMLLVVSLYWVATELPATIVLGLKQVFDSPTAQSIEEARSDPKTKSYLNYLTARFIIEMLCFSRYSCKLFLYLGTGRIFRNHLRRIVLKCCKEKYTAKRDSQYSNGRPNLCLFKLKQHSHYLEDGEGTITTDIPQENSPKQKRASLEPKTKTKFFFEEDEKLIVNTNNNNL